MNKFKGIASWEEIIGILAFSIGIASYVTQFEYTRESLNVKSFSIIGLFLALFSEMFFALQGYIKGSPTIILTRVTTTIAVLVFVIMWYVIEENESSK